MSDNVMRGLASGGIIGVGNSYSISEKWWAGAEAAFDSLCKQGLINGAKKQSEIEELLIAELYRQRGLAKGATL